MKKGGRKKRWGYGAADEAQSDLSEGVMRDDTRSHSTSTVVFCNIYIYGIVISLYFYSSSLTPYSFSLLFPLGML